MRYKNILAASAAAMAAGAAVSGSAYATDLTSGIDFTATKGEISSITKTYDEQTNINKVKATVTYTGTAADVLAHRPGNTSDLASLSQLYFGLNSGISLDSGKMFRINNVRVAAGETDLAGKAAQLVETLNSDEPVSPVFKTVWPASFQVQYSTNGGTTWQNSTSKGNGTVSIKDDLKAKLGINLDAEFIYGVNYRFAVNTDSNFLYVWQTCEGDATECVAVEDSEEFILISMDVAFPIMTVEGSKAIFQENFDKALSSKTSNTVIINSGSVTSTLTNTTFPAGKNIVVEGGSLTLGSDIVIPSNTTITVKSGATLTIGANTTAGAYSIVEEEGSTVNGKENLSVKRAVTVETVSNGTVTLDNANGLYGAGDTVTITTTPDDGYLVSKVEYSVDGGKTYTDTSRIFLSEVGTVVWTNTFVMPSDKGPVSVRATFEEFGTPGNGSSSSSSSSSSTVITTPNTSAGDDSSNTGNTGSTSTSKPSTEDSAAAVANETAAAKVLSSTLDDMIKSDSKLAAAVKDAKEVEAVITTEDLVASKVALSTRDTIAGAAARYNRNMKVANYFEISVDIFADGKDVGDIHELNSTVKFTIDIPSDLPAVKAGYTRIYSVIRMHNGKAEVLPATTSADGKSATFESDKFSTYALAYVDVKNSVTTPDTAGTIATESNATSSILVGLMSAIVAAGYAISKAVRRIR